MERCKFLNHSIIAHRGIYNNITIYENTMESIRYAVKNNLIFEIDIRLTKDNEVIVFHDEDGTRLLKLKDKINTMTYEELNYISHFHIPTLDEVLKYVDGIVPIIIEIKEDSKVMRNKLLEILKNYKGQFALQSFEYEVIRFFRKKDFIVGLLIGKNKNINYLDKNINVDFINIRYDLLTKVEANMLKKKYYLIGYTLDNRIEVEMYIKVFNNLIIDNIEEVFK